MDIVAIVIVTAITMAVAVYVLWKVRSLYVLLGDRRRDIDFHSLYVWVVFSPAYANWRLGSQIKAFDDLPKNLTEQLPLIRHQAQIAKRVCYGLASTLLAIFVLILFVRN